MIFISFIFLVLLEYNLNNFKFTIFYFAKKMWELIVFFSGTYSLASCRRSCVGKFSTVCISATRSACSILSCALKESSVLRFTNIPLTMFWLADYVFSLFKGSFSFLRIKFCFCFKVLFGKRTLFPCFKTN